ncbi:MAG: NAD(P)/FAD-dependent oxidoreductase [Ignavibacteriae bacterium]|nr:NAD(P)/FAD-dependent oxidoreductase [Ignavibacteriota bacterium]
MDKIFDVIIIGAGPAGIAAAIQLKRYGLDFLLLEKDEEGGLLRNAFLVENFPGFPNGISGKSLISLFKKHLNAYGIKARKERVIDVKHKKNIYSVITKKNILLSRRVVIATGTKPIEYEPSGLLKKNFYYEVHELRETKNKAIAIIGGGDAAFDYAYNLAGRDNKINILMRGGSPSCIPALLKKVRKSENITINRNAETIKVVESGDRVLIHCIISGRKKIFISDILIAAVGREPQADFLKSISKKEYNALRKNSLYFAGDVKNKIYRQAAISIGDGIRTAMEIYGKIKNEN